MLLEHERPPRHGLTACRLGIYIHLYECCPSYLCLLVSAACVPQPGAQAMLTNKHCCRLFGCNFRFETCQLETYFACYRLCCKTCVEAESHFQLSVPQ